MILGVFRVPSDPPIDTRLHRALVVVLTSHPHYQLARPFEKAALFDDDQFGDRGAQIGYFAFELFDHCPDGLRGTFYVFVSLGAHLSNTISIEVQ